MSVLSYLSHEIFQKKRFSLCQLKFLHPQKELKPNLIKKIFIDSLQQSIQRFWRQQIDDFLLYISISKSLLAINLLSMCPHLNLHLLLHLLILQFSQKLQIHKSSLEVICKNSYQQSDNFSHDVSEEDGLRDQSKDGINTLNWIFGSDISVCNCSNYSYTVIHNVGIHLCPS